MKQDEKTEDRPHVLSRDCWCNPAVEYVEGDRAERESRI